MKKIIITACALMACLSTAEGADDMAKTTKILMKTNKGDIELELYPEKAPETVKNFVQYANDGFYNGTIFHRVIPGFMNQGGGFTKDMVQKDTRAPVKNEADNGLSNKKGTIAMARTSVPDSATGQFFINTADNDFLNHTGKTAQGWGYAVFGKVTKGMDVVDKISAVKTASNPPHQNVPVEAVEIKEVSVIE